ncbi:SLC13 family permease [Zunongwangia sp. HGR-M22]|uniref:SLC13 family permease n=1 Tax=Zunongwangia sp. HGR-M22 TaxID=3015168 RepID=UPI0022DD8768|nr:DASS family sodium-coupled anion symporter [Zunongwangia sp. HGR-M22]WBL25217.1 DASS family sodium-coupled anion symporter [Zunongwangia sp. HGR-M22]
MNNTLKSLILISGPLIFGIFQFSQPPAEMSPAAFDVLAITLWMAIWWVTEIIPIAATALLPIVLFPLSGVLDLGLTTASYGHKYVFLYMGGFILAVAIEKWNLHRRIALNIINLIGTNIKYIILGFMLATAFLSMWISNTATSVMMLPIGTAIINQLKDNPDTSENESKLFGKALMLAIAYSASIGGIGTLIGTPPNLVFAGIIEELYRIEISFLKWALLGIPISILLLAFCWKYLTSFAFSFKQTEFPGGKSEIKKLLSELGNISLQEKRVLIIFVLTAICWITRSFFLDNFLPNIDDTIIAMAAAICLFLVPSGKNKEKQKRLLNWEEAIKIPWGIILLFGGGMALARAFDNTGLANWIGEQLVNLENLPLFILLLILVSAMNFLTEVTSNTATTAMLLPILAPMALALNLHPYMLMVGATLAASCAFMLPVATPPNAVVFGSGHLKIADMMKTGFWLNIVSIILISLIVYFILPLLWDFDPFTIPKVFK